MPLFSCQFVLCLLDFWLEFSCPGLQGLCELVSPRNRGFAELAVGVGIVHELFDVFSIGDLYPLQLVVHVSCLLKIL
jgi:hypothetical protein